MKKLFLIILLGALSACVSNPSANYNVMQTVENGRLVPQAGTGIAIVSLTFTTLDRDTAEADLQIDGVNGRTALKARLPSDYIRSQSNDADPMGRVFVVSLPAGNYALSRVVGNWLMHGSGERNYVNVETNKPFSIKAGEVVYLGEVHLDMNFQSTVQYKQNSTRDFHHVQRRHDVTDFSNVKNQLLGSQ
ncbi:hypothetical protein [Chitinibacter sp. S2-10]|uniref:hypothetical protein n=1 Tax=Chitinibacter sp. S2-10 TaxID=3373597 RepID=UPI003977C877